MLKQLLRRPAVQRLVGVTLANYLKLCHATSRVTFDPPDLYARLEPNMPIICATWHGEHFLLPFMRRARDKTKVLMSRHRDGEMNAVAVERLGSGLIRGSGSHDGQKLDKRGARAFLEMVKAMRDGYNIVSTADVPKVAKTAGLGIVTLAKHTGRPIVPSFVVTSRRKEVRRSWDRTKIPFPFGRIVMAIGEPIHVPADADDETMEHIRARVESELNAVMARAYARLEQPRGS